jgi:hypothetical protein
MPSKNTPFTIDDALSVSDGLATFRRVLEEIDEPLGMALGAFLSSPLAAGRSIDVASIWDAMNAAGMQRDKDDHPCLDEVTGRPAGTP